MKISNVMRSKALAIIMAATMLIGVISVLPTEITATATSSWQTEGSLPVNVSAAAYAQINNTVYIFGGYGTRTGSSESFFDTSFSYNLSSGQIKGLAHMPMGTYASAAAAGPNGKIYVFGGFNVSIHAATTQIYDITSNTWSFGALMPVGGAFLAAASDNGNYIYVVGGENTSALSAMTNVQVYGTLTNSWTAATDLPYGVSMGSMVMTDDGFYYLGGQIGGVVTDKVLHASLTGGAWTDVALLPQPTLGMAATVGVDGMIYSLGGSSSFGWGSSPLSNAAYAYDPALNTWKHIPEIIPVMKYMGSAATKDGKIYAFGGTNYTKYVPTIRSLRILTTSTSVDRTSVGQGQSVMCTINIDALRSIDWYQTDIVLIAADKSSYMLASVFGIEGTLHFPLVIPQEIPAGTYTLSYTDLTIHDGSATFSVPLASHTITIFATVSQADQIAALQAQLSSVTTALNAMNNSNNQGLSGLSADNNATDAQIAGLKAQIDALQADLNASQADLGSLQASDNGLQSSVDKKADGTLMLLTLVMVIAVLVLLVVNMVLGRKK